MFLDAEFLGRKGVQWHVSRDEYIPVTSKNNTAIFRAINIHFKNLNPPKLRPASHFTDT